ncbi:DUF4381 domain-containing protein [uncultured Salipiger sp.]|uniref:DUF4381 domain-containing protein n=1 Tax=uncultured Salipiger sp. TaxID=499810 RepID=UPI0025982C82|nr:DUF4381 domain-containing protein [uncultured Salipiger sp.]
MTDDDAPDTAESLVALIDLLVEPPPPVPVPLTPQTWGWAGLALLLLALVVLGLWRWLARRRANAYRRAALADLGSAATTAELAEILRRAALAAWPRTEVAALAGADWTRFLDRTGKGGFPAAAGEELRRATYRDTGAAPSPELRAAAGRWLRSHRAGPTAARAPS